MMSSRIFGNLPTGESVEAYTLRGSAGASVEILTFGGIVRSLCVPDREGRLADVVLGFNEVASYVGDGGYTGAITGRIAGRVTGGRIQVDGQIYPLPLNDGPNHLHGGFTGLNRRLWSASVVERADGAEALRLFYRSPEGEEGYPGSLEIAVTYAFTADNALVIDTEVSADRETPVALTHHSYFNLAGEGTGDVAGHVFELDSDEFVPADKVGTNSGKREAVSEELGNDFRQPTLLGPVLDRFGKVHGLHLLAPNVTRANPVARLSHPASGRVLTVSTTEDFLQTYSAAHFDGSLTGKSGGSYVKSGGLCLECQGYPNATTETGFGDILVRPGQPQRHTTIYQFSTQ